MSVDRTPSRTGPRPGDAEPGAGTAGGHHGDRRGDVGHDADTGDRVLRWSALLYAVGFLVHNGDHVRRGFDVLTRHVLWAGTFSTLLAIVTLGLVATRHRLAPFAAAAVGLPTALGVAAVHLLPEWSALSDSLPDGDVDALSWVAVLTEIAGAAALGLAGLHVLRRQGLLLGRTAVPET